jgi:hypothetical protein
MVGDKTPKNIRHIFNSLDMARSDNQLLFKRVSDKEWTLYDSGQGSVFWLAYSAYCFLNEGLFSCILSLGVPYDVAPYVNVGSTNIINDFYFDFVESVTNDIHDYDLTILSKNKKLEDLARTIITTSFKGSVIVEYIDEIKSTSTDKQLECLHRLGMNLSSKTKGNNKMERSIGILVIVDNEYAAVKEYLNDNFGLEEVESEKFRETKHITKLPSKDGFVHNVILKSALDMGNRSVINAAQRMAD